MNRVVITGIGIVSPVGCTLSDFWSALVEARSGVGPITIIPTEGLLIRIAAQVLGFDPTAHFESRQANLLDRFARFAVVAARAAGRDAGLEMAARPLCAVRRRGRPRGSSRRRTGDR